jgi:hypothetical protein
MKTTDKREIKKLYTIAISDYLKKENWERLEAELPAAENIGVANKQLQKAWIELGVHQKRQDKLVSALVSFASARIHDLDNNRILAEILECLEGFISAFESKFSREDLVRLEYGLNRVYLFHKSRSETSEENLRKAKELLKRIKAKKEFAPLRRETPATQHVLRIYGALYPGMTEAEVQVEFAKVVAPIFRKKLAEVKQNPSAPGGKKPPKDKDKNDDDDNNPEK